ncbi:unnamed protein product [Ixodes hexagonus]
MEPTTFQWTLSRQKALLGFFRNHESMYNPRHVDYRNRRLRERLLNQLKDMIGCSPYEAKSKFHSLRTYFTKELNKVRHSKLPGNGPVYHSKWELFHDMLFVKDVYQPRPPLSCYPAAFVLDVAPTDSNGTPTNADVASTNADTAPTEADAMPTDADATPTDSAFNYQELEVESADMEAGTPIEFAPLPTQSSLEEAQSGNTHIEIRRPRTLKVTQKKRRREDECWSSDGGGASGEAREPAPAPQGDDKDDDFYFAMMIAKELKHLRPLDKDMLKLRMMEMIVEAKHNVMLEKCTRVVQLTE